MTAQVQMIQYVLENIDWKNKRSNTNFAAKRLYDCICESRHLIKMNDVLEKSLHMVLFAQYLIGAVFVCTFIYVVLQVSAINWHYITFRQYI